MSIFRRDSSEAKPPSRPEPAKPNPRASSPGAQPPKPTRAPAVGKTTLIAPGSHLEGTLSGPAELLIEGQVTGHVNPENHVEIGQRGKVVGDVTARSARIAGHVVGNVLGGEVVELTETGRLEGDVKAPRVIISEGAFFRGNVEMGPPRAKEEARR